MTGQTMQADDSVVTVSVVTPTTSTTTTTTSTTNSGRHNSTSGGNAASAGSSTPHEESQPPSPPHHPPSPPPPSRTLPPVSAWELWGWYLYDAGCAAFSSVALPIFFPLLLTEMAAAAAWQQNGQQQPQTCGSSAAAAAAEEGGSAAGCVQCVVGKGDMLLLPDGSQQALSARVHFGALHIDPVAFATIAIGISVVLQVLVFISFGPLADYGHGRKNMLTVGTCIGALACACCILLLSPSLWWLSGVLLIVANVGFGVALIAYYSYLPVLVDASPEVLAGEAAALPEKAQQKVREEVENRISLIGVAAAGISSVLATLAAFAVASTVKDQILQLRVAILCTGVWWLLLFLFTVAWLQARPGPPGPASGKLSPFVGWQQLWKMVSEAKLYKNAFAFVLCYFVYADGFNTIMQIGVLFGQRDLCLTNANLILLATSVSFWAALGTPVFFFLQKVTSWNNKRMVILLLILMWPLPLWGLLGFVTPADSIGLKQTWELFVFGGWFGLCLGALLSYSRTLFIDMIPVGREASFFSLYSISDKGSSWLGPFIVAVIVQTTGQLRYSFIYILIVMTIPVLFVHLFVNHEQGVSDAGRARLHDEAGIADGTSNTNGMQYVSMR